MNEFMIHVEQIVRPVRAFASRKLRMRQELLAHLRAALDEERAADGNEAAALQRAKTRLGEPVALTRALQQSVPWIERALMARLPIPGALERWEIRSASWRKDCPLTPMQSTVLLAGAAMLPFVDMLSLALRINLDRPAAQQMMFERPRAWVMMNLGSLVLTFGSFAICARFIVAVASLKNALRSLRVRAYAAGIISLPALSILLLLACVNRRPASGRELLLSFILGAVLLASQILVGRLIGFLRRPYAEWLMLDVAG